jgi:hypothetical protein
MQKATAEGSSQLQAFSHFTAANLEALRRHTAVLNESWASHPGSTDCKACTTNLQVRVAFLTVKLPLHKLKAKSFIKQFTLTNAAAYVFFLLY